MKPKAMWLRVTKRANGTLPGESPKGSSLGSLYADMGARSRSGSRRRSKGDKGFKGKGFKGDDKGWGKDFDKGFGKGKGKDFKGKRDSRSPSKGRKGKGDFKGRKGRSRSHSGPVSLS